MDIFLYYILPGLVLTIIAIVLIHHWAPGLKNIQFNPPFGLGEDPGTASGLIEEYLEMGRIVEAIIVAKKAIKTWPHEPDLRILLAQAYESSSKEKLAIPDSASTFSPD
ncbi:MAG: tetratricopeptide repeat protein [Deltaproteobacteria bacterium]|nr:tetratricopeptide repeat protein [Deltaproteobacteria bacterium]